jgi:phage shock protein A
LETPGQAANWQLGKASAVLAEADAGMLQLIARRRQLERRVSSCLVRRTHTHAPALVAVAAAAAAGSRVGSPLRT